MRKDNSQSRDERSLRQIKLNWELAMFICAACLGAPFGAGFVSLFVEPSPTTWRSTYYILGGVTAVALLMFTVPIVVRYRRLEARERRHFAWQISGGLMCLIGAAVATYASYQLSAEAGWYLVPTGMFVVGLLMIARVLSPPA